MDANAIIENFRNIVTKQYFDFNGRTRRRDFWLYVLVYFIIYIVVSFIESILGFRGGYGYPYMYYSFNPLTSILSLALLLPSLGIGARRLHDIGRSAWWMLIGLIPVVGWLILLYWNVQPGTAGTNEFGPDPKSGTAAAAA
jgi:uncharacterized membrane protein YhaH (DUF805 family)